MPLISLAAFSDIHHANYASGVTEADVYQVEEDITDFCLVRKVSFCLFNGDRYLSHTPKDDIRVWAEKSQRRRNDEGIITFSLLGNHDWEGKGVSTGHSNRLVQMVWPDLHPNLVIMDKPGTYRHPKVTGVAIHALPAGFERFDWSYFNFVEGEYNILVFHFLMEGAQLDVTTGYRAPKGIALAELDHAVFDCVLGGDIHIPQKLPFKNTRGGYVGSPIQQSRRDRGGANGWLYVELEDKEFRTEFIESRSPRFVEAQWVIAQDDVAVHAEAAGAPGVGFSLPTAQEIEGLVQQKYGISCKGNIVDIVIEGPKLVLDEATKTWRDDVCNVLQARRVNPPIRKVKVPKPLTSLPEKVSGTPIEEFESFLKSGRAPLQGLDVERLMTKATSVLSKVIT
jgi:hypothetical protein